MSDVTMAKPSPEGQTRARPERITLSTTRPVMVQLAALTNQYQCSAAELIERMIGETHEYGLRGDPASVKRNQRQAERAEFERLSLNTARGKLRRRLKGSILLHGRLQ